MWFQWSSGYHSCYVFLRPRLQIRDPRQSILNMAFIVFLKYYLTVNTQCHSDFHVYKAGVAKTMAFQIIIRSNVISLFRRFGGTWRSRSCLSTCWINVALTDHLIGFYCDTRTRWGWIALKLTRAYIHAPTLAIYCFENCWWVTCLATLEHNSTRRGTCPTNARQLSSSTWFCFGILCLRLLNCVTINKTDNEQQRYIESRTLSISLIRCANMWSRWHV
jgi:hypothetical protein